jgi:hypothetical protein
MGGKRWTDRQKQALSAENSRNLWIFEGFSPFVFAQYRFLFCA